MANIYNTLQKAKAGNIYEKPQEIQPDVKQANPMVARNQMMQANAASPNLPNRQMPINVAQRGNFVDPSVIMRLQQMPNQAFNPYLFKETYGNNPYMI
jgi:3-oxoacyl-[acyl-carrier-protein] synthase III